MISMLRGNKPSERTSWLGSASFSSTSTSTSWSRSSLASIIPVGPPPLMITSGTLTSCCRVGVLRQAPRCAISWNWQGESSPCLSYVRWSGGLPGKGYADGEAGAEVSEPAELAELDELDAGAED